MKTCLSRHQTAKVSHSRWLAYATATAATTLAGGHSMEAEIHYSGLLHTVFPRHETTLKTFQLDQPGDFFQLTHSTGGFVGFRVSGIASTAGFRFAPCGCDQYYVLNLSFGQNIGSGYFLGASFFATMAPGFPDPYFLQWLDHGVGFVGFKFNNGAGIQLGWARVKMGGLNNNNGFMLLDYAYADPGEPITAGQRSSAGQTPDQGSLGWLALGAMGLLAWRKRRSQSARLEEI